MAASFHLPPSPLQPKYKPVVSVTERLEADDVSCMISLVTQRDRMRHETRHLRELVEVIPRLAVTNHLLPKAVDTLLEVDQCEIAEERLQLLQGELQKVIHQSELAEAEHERLLRINQKLLQVAATKEAFLSQLESRRRIGGAMDGEVRSTSLKLESQQRSLTGNCGVFMTEVRQLREAATTSSCSPHAGGTGGSRSMSPGPHAGSSPSPLLHRSNSRSTLLSLNGSKSQTHHHQQSGFGLPLGSRPSLNDARDAMLTKQQCLLRAPPPLRGLMRGKDRQCEEADAFLHAFSMAKQQQQQPLGGFAARVKHPQQQNASHISSSPMPSRRPQEHHQPDDDDEEAKADRLQFDLRMEGHQLAAQCRAFLDDVARQADAMSLHAAVGGDATTNQRGRSPSNVGHGEAASALLRSDSCEAALRTLIQCMEPDTMTRRGVEWLFNCCQKPTCVERRRKVNYLAQKLNRQV